MARTFIANNHFHSVDCVVQLFEATDTIVQGKRTTAIAAQAILLQSATSGVGLRVLDNSWDNTTGSLAFPRLPLTPWEQCDVAVLVAQLVARGE